MPIPVPNTGPEENEPEQEKNTFQRSFPKKMDAEENRQL